MMQYLMNLILQHHLSYPILELIFQVKNAPARVPPPKKKKVWKMRQISILLQRDVNTILTHLKLQKKIFYRIIPKWVILTFAAV